MNHFAEYDVDTQNKDPSRLSRLPGCIRGDTGNEQTLLAVNMGAKSWVEWEEFTADSFPTILTQEEFDNEDISEPPPIIDGLLNRQLSLVLGEAQKHISLGRFSIWQFPPQMAFPSGDSIRTQGNVFI